MGTIVGRRAVISLAICIQVFSGIGLILSLRHLLETPLDPAPGSEIWVKVFAEATGMSACSVAYFLRARKFAAQTIKRPPKRLQTVGLLFMVAWAFLTAAGLASSTYANPYIWYGSGLLCMVSIIEVCILSVAFGGEEGETGDGK